VLRTKLTTISLLLALAAPLAAQEEDYATRLGILLGGGVGKYVGGEIDQTSLGPILQGGFRVGVKRKFDILADVRYGSFKTAGLPADSFDVFLNPRLELDSTRVDLQYYNRTWQFEIGLQYNFKEDGRWSPWVLGVFGATLWRVKDLTGKSAGMFTDGPTLRGFDEGGGEVRLSDSNLHLAFGAGAEFEVVRRTWLQVGGRIDYLIDQKTDNTGASAAYNSASRVDANDILWSLYAGVHYFFSDKTTVAEAPPSPEGGE
jgi:hypothetical protein